MSSGFDLSEKVNDFYYLHNVVLDCYSSSTKNHKLSGEYFVIDLRDQTFHHFFVDQVAQFLYLQGFFGCKLVLIHLPDKKYPSYISWTIDKIIKDYEPFEVVLGGNGILEIEKIVVLSTRLIPFYEQVGAELFDRMQDEPYQEMLIPGLRRFLLKHISTERGRERVYISRRPKSAEVIQQKEYLDLMKKNGISWSKELRKVYDPEGALEDLPTPHRLLGVSPWVIEEDTVGRYLSPEAESELENIFLSNGYVMVDHTKVDFEEQLKVCATANSIAVFNGASAIFTVVAPADCTVIILNPNTKWAMRIPHHIASITNDNVKHILSPYGAPNTDSAELMIHKVREFFRKI